MANEAKITQFVQEAGYEPLKDRCIIVKYAPENLDGTLKALTEFGNGVS